MLALATAGGAGLAPVAPGTVGAGVGVLAFLPLSALSPVLYGLTVTALTFLGVWAADAAERVYGHDDRRIVIDEVVGQLLTLSPLLFLGRPRSVPWLVTGFVLFRVFDVWKPRPVRWAERGFAGGAGVMLDDVVAALISAATLALLLLLFGVRPA